MVFTPDLCVAAKLITANRDKNRSILVSEFRLLI
jgi:hypothetical protein